jgi:transcriptional regulator with XRE-family HTH domain
MAEESASAVLLVRVREGMKRRGLNTAALAAKAGAERGLVRSVLAGRKPLTVDLLFALIEALQFTPEELGLPAGSVADRMDLSVPGRACPSAPERSAPPAPPPCAADRSLPPHLVAPPDMPEGNAAFDLDDQAPQAREILRCGFALGVDMHLVCTTSRLGTSGIPGEVLKRFPDLVPIKLDATYHHANRARYLPEGLELRLSFDRVRTCLLPWASIRQITLLPEPPEETQEEDLAPPRPGSGGPTLRLVRS